LKLSVTVPQVLLGLPMKGSQNPYLVSPAGAAGFEASYEEGCSGLRVDNIQAEVAGKLSNFWSRLASGLSLSVREELAPLVALRGLNCGPAARCGQVPR